ncbi:hypothetical protein [Catellatospora citrea]|nr:hypothetical protein [Catellatospora citrea]RKE09923.1 hypothetical protein C8E86_4817 [Catellatospora citrea]
MSIPVEQNKRPVEHQRVPKIDEDVTTVIVQVGEIAETQKKHTALLERHTLLLKEIKQNQIDARLDRRVLLTRQERTEIAVANLGDEVSDLKTDVSQIKDTLGVILSRLPEQPAA